MMSSLKTVFSNISKYCVHYIGSVGLLTKLSIHAANFTNNANTAVNVEQCNITLNSVTFYNNVNVNSGYIDDGGAIRVYNGIASQVTGNVSFYYNRAGNNGRAIYLNHSVMLASQGSILFHNNTAKNGGAIYIGEGSRLYATLYERSLEFLDNNATSNGGALYVDLHHINDVTISHQLSNYYYDLLTSTTGTCNLSNTAGTAGNCIYFNKDFSTVHSPAENYSYYSNVITSSSICPYSFDTSSYTSTVNLHISNITDGSFSFWSHDLYLYALIYDCNGNPAGLINASFQCCDNTNIFSCTVDTTTDNYNFTVTSSNTNITCSNSKTISCTISAFNNPNITNPGYVSVLVQQFGHVCDDIAHTYFGNYCMPVCSYSSSQDNCAT